VEGGGACAGEEALLIREGGALRLVAALAINSSR